MTFQVPARKEGKYVLSTPLLYSSEAYDGSGRISLSWSSRLANNDKVVVDEDVAAAYAIPSGGPPENPTEDPHRAATVEAKKVRRSSDWRGS